MLTGDWRRQDWASWAIPPWGTWGAWGRGPAGRGHARERGRHPEQNQTCLELACARSSRGPCERDGRGGVPQLPRDSGCVQGATGGRGREGQPDSQKSTESSGIGLQGQCGCQEGEGPQAGPCWGESHPPKFWSARTLWAQPPERETQGRGRAVLSSSPGTREAQQMHWGFWKLPSSWAWCLSGGCSAMTRQDRLGGPGRAHRHPCTAVRPERLARSHVMWATGEEPDRRGWDRLAPKPATGVRMAWTGRLARTLLQGRRPGSLTLWAGGGARRVLLR